MKRGCACGKKNKIINSLTKVSDPWCVCRAHCENQAGDKL